ncbi:unnamed protein product [Chrysodeixis includens]|uniref:Uncharacterized protein n=1 Tax=Chrysodeixis includens TaxID=689277 RepID=A0A9N8Q2U2_CHRIL|nr:unnamed protein product [Chrysodeixis includens]
MRNVQTDFLTTFVRLYKDDVVRKMLDMNVDGYRKRTIREILWMDYVKDDMAAKSVTCEMTSDRNVRKKKTCSADPIIIIGMMMITMRFNYVV